MSRNDRDRSYTEEHFSYASEGGNEQDSGVRRRLWIAGSLVVLIIVLFVADRYVTLVQPNIERMQTRRDLQSVESLEEDVRKVLDDYGVQPEWVRERSIDFDHLGHVRDHWLVQVPHDLPLASVNLDLKEAIEQYGGKAFAVENARKAYIALHITFRGMVRYSLLFMPTTDVHREAGRVVLLVDGISDAPGSEIDRYMESREPIACILEPDKDNIPLHTRLRKMEKEVVLHLHFKPVSESESRFELAEDLSENDLASHLRYIVKNYPGCRAYYLTSERALGMYSRMVDDIMRSLGYRKLDSSTLSYIDRGSREGVMSARMNDIAALSVRENVSVGVVELRDDIMHFLTAEMKRLRKKGFDFVGLRHVWEE
ncbi:MAG: hypothetical protein RRA94_06895 [Bacteroidota bacterium]|nr:hypothetical protein [Bacteroidota bacterium]